MASRSMDAALEQAAGSARSGRIRSTRLANALYALCWLVLAASGGAAFAGVLWALAALPLSALCYGASRKYRWDALLWAEEEAFFAREHQRLQLARMRRPSETKTSGDGWRIEFHKGGENA